MNVPGVNGIVDHGFHRNGTAESAHSVGTFQLYQALYHFAIYRNNRAITAGKLSFGGYGFAGNVVNGIPGPQAGRNAYQRGGGSIHSFTVAFNGNVEDLFYLVQSIGGLKALCHS